MTNDGLTPPTAVAGPDFTTPVQRRSSRRWIPAVAVLVVVAVVGAAALIVTSTGSDESTVDFDAAWNTIATVDFETGDVALIDRDGQRTDRISVDVEEPRVIPISSTHFGVTGDDRLVIIDAATGETVEVDVPDDLSVFAAGDVVAPVALLGGFGERMVVVDVSGRTLDVADELGWDEPRIDVSTVRGSPDGSHIALVDLGREFRTAIVDVAEMTAVEVSGAVLTLTNDGVFTALSQVGQRDESTVEMFTFDGESLGSTDVDRVSAAIDDGNGGLITVGIEGRIRRVSPRDDESERLGRLDTDDFVGQIRSSTGPEPALVVVAPNDERGDTGDRGDIVHIVDGSGSVVATIPLSEVNDVRAGIGSRPCATIATGDEALIVDLADGDVIASVDDERNVPGLFGTPDQCTALFFGPDGDIVLSRSGEAELAEGERVRALSPDGRFVVIAIRDDGGSGALRIVLRSLGAEANDDADDPDDTVDDVELEADPRAFILFLDV